MRCKVLAFVLAFTVILSNALADGVIVDVPFDGGIYEPASKPKVVDESEQVAFIFWENGMEQMIIKVGLKSAAEKNGMYVWIFPVPADPGDVVVQHIKEMSYDVGGKELYEATKDELKEEMDGIFALSQIWPMIPAIFEGEYTSAEVSMGRETSALEVDGLLPERDYGVTVHETVEKYGLVSEIITAREADGLRRYIRDKHGVELPREIEEVFSDYIGKEFTFVVSESKGSPKAMAVMVEFPSDAPYFPMKPTSVYGSKVIPITVYVDGFWEPNTWREIKNRVKVEHKVDGEPPEISSDEEFQGEFEKFTVLSMNAPSKYMKEDFYFKGSGVAEGINAIRKHKTVLGIAMMLIIFGMSGLAAWAALSKKRDELKKYISAGAASILTPIASFIVLKRAGITSQISINAPAFKKWWQNVAFYATGAFFAILTILLLSIPAAIMYGLITMLHSIGGAYAVAVGIMLYTAGGALFWAVVGAAILHLMGKKWGQDSATVSVQLPVPQVLAIIILNAVLYAVLKAVLLA